MSRATPRSTVLRVAALRLLIEELGKGEVHRDDAKKLLKVSPSGIRAYFSTLVRNEIAEVARREYVDRRRSDLSKPGYRLIADADQVERFLAAQCEPRKKEKPVPAIKLARATLADQGRHFHFMQDDTPFLPKVHSWPVAPDPFALPEGFFSAGAGVAA